MAGTIIFSQFEDGKVSIEGDYNDSLKLTTLRIENGALENRAGVTIFRTVTDAQGNVTRDGVSYGLTCNPAAQEGTPTLATLDIPVGAQGIPLTLSSKPGHFEGYQLDLRYPW